MDLYEEDVEALGCDYTTHEGHVVGVIRDLHPGDPAVGTYDVEIWRELRFFDRDTHKLDYIQIACTCGWRSERIMAPAGTDWSPCSVFFDSTYHRADSTIFPSVEDIEDATRLFWQQRHIDPLIGARRGNGRPGGLLYDLADTCREIRVGQKDLVS